MATGIFEFRVDLDQLDTLQGVRHNGGQFLVTQHVRLTAASLVIRSGHDGSLTTGQVELHYSFYGRKKDGQEHRRRTHRSINFGSGQTARTLGKMLLHSASNEIQSAAFVLMPEGSDR